MGRKRKKVNRKKKIQRERAILLAGIFVIFGIFVGIKFMPKHQQDNISITKPNENENGQVIMKNLIIKIKLIIIS